MKGNITNNLRALIISFIMLFRYAEARATVPRPDHVVICVLENHAYQQVIGSSSAPYINHLASVGANMGEFYGLTHPSQPNYLMMFSGNNQGETSDNLPTGTPYTTMNLGSSLINSGFTFAGYSEDLPATGSLVEVSGLYMRKHSPWVNWQGTGTNQISSSCNRTLDNFPSDFSQLPDVSFVIPNMVSSMHNGTDPSRISTGDDFVHDYLSAYENWAMNNNSLLIVFFDEDNSASSNHIPCIFVGPMVTPGIYSQTGYDHYDMLRTLEDMFGLPYAGHSATGKPIEEIWRTTAGISDVSASPKSSVYPNPMTDVSYITLNNQLGTQGKITVQLNDILGNIVSEEITLGKPESRTFPIRKNDLKTGIYFYKILQENNVICSGKIMVR